MVEGAATRAIHPAIGANLSNQPLRAAHPQSTFALMTDLAAPRAAKASAKPSRILGRSPLTGQPVLRPASKQGAISLAMARKAVASLYPEKPK